MPKILLIDDNKSRLQAMEAVLQFMEFDVDAAGSSGMNDLTSDFSTYSCIFAGDGIPGLASFIKKLTDLSHGKPVVLLVEKGTGLQVPNTINELILQVLEWPVSYSSFKVIADKIGMSNGQYGQRLPMERRVGDRRSPSIDRLKGNSPAIVTIRKLIFQVAESDATVLVLGESGTGKEVVARALHDASLRNARPFVPINCGAIPGELLESELFGHEKGAFTGAVAQTKGKIEYANGGTFFLDEIGDLPFPLQAKLLRFLQEKTIERIGGRKEISVDVRVLCATHQNIQSLIDEGRFRSDLYYRISEITLNIPPLREREGDALAIATALVNRYSQLNNKKIKGLGEDAIDAIEHYHWPGNVRELENKIKRAVIMADGTLLTAQDLELKTVSLNESGQNSLNLKAVREVAETNAILKALSRTNNNISNAAKLLGVTRPTLYTLFEKYGIQINE